MVEDTWQDVSSEQSRAKRKYRLLRLCWPAGCSLEEVSPTKRLHCTGDFVFPVLEETGSAKRGSVCEIDRMWVIDCSELHCLVAEFEHVGEILFCRISQICDVYYYQSKFSEFWTK
jgi:hypothetical protein